MVSYKKIQSAAVRQLFGSLVFYPAFLPQHVEPQHVSLNIIDQSPGLLHNPGAYLEHFPPAMKTGTHRADGTIKEIRNFFVVSPSISHKMTTVRKSSGSDWSACVTSSLSMLLYIFCCKIIRIGTVRPEWNRKNFPHLRNRPFPVPCFLPVPLI